MTPPKPPDTDIAFVLQWDDASIQDVHRVLLREVYAGAERYARTILASTENAHQTVLRGLAEAAACRREYTGQEHAAEWVFRFVVQAVLAQARKRKLGSAWIKAATAEAGHDHYRMPPPDEETLEKLLADLAGLAPARRPGIRHRWREAGWAVLLAAAIFILLIRFNAGLSSETGDPLFPTDAGATPTAISANPASGSTSSLPAPLAAGMSETGDIFLLAQSAPFDPVQVQARSPVVLSSLNGLALSADGRLAASVVNQEIVLWSLPAGQPRGVFPIDTPNDSLAFGTQTAHLATSGPGTGTVLVWDVEEAVPRLLYSLEAQDGAVTSLAFSPNDTFLVIGTSAGIWIWELADSGEARLVRSIRQRNVTTLAVSPDGRFFATGGLKGIVDLRSLPEGEIVHRLGGHAPWIKKVIFSPDGQRLAVGGYDHVIHIWRLAENMADPPRLEFNGSVPLGGGGKHSLAFSPDARLFAVSNSGSIVVFLLEESTSDRIVFFSEGGQAGGLAFTPDGQLLVSAGLDGKLYLYGPPEAAERIAEAQALEAIDPEFAFFQPQDYDSHPTRRVYLLENGALIDPTTPLEILYSLSTREFSSRTGIYTPIPDNIPENAVYLGERNSGARIVSVYYELPFGEYQTVLLTVHLPTGVSGPALLPEDFPDRRVGESAEIVVAALGSDRLPAELLLGGWVFVESGPVAIPTDRSWVVVEGKNIWHGEPVWLTLRWAQNGILFEIHAFPHDPQNPRSAGRIPEGILINLAEQMIDQFSQSP